MANCAASQSYRGAIAFDTLQDALHQERGDITCIIWKKRKICGDIRTSAIIVVPVKERESTCRRRGWMEIEGDNLFQDDPRDITLV
jgi:hypothetical protein